MNFARAAIIVQCVWDMDTAKITICAETVPCSALRQAAPYAKNVLIYFVKPAENAKFVPMIIFVKIVGNVQTIGI